MTEQTATPNESLMYSGDVMKAWLAQGNVFLFVGERTEATLNLAQVIREMQPSCNVALAVVNQDLIDAMNERSTATTVPPSLSDQFLSVLMADFHRIIATKDVEAAKAWNLAHDFTGWWADPANDTPELKEARDSAILEAFHTNYSDWIVTQLNDIRAAAYNAIFPIKRNGRRYAMYND